MFRGATNVGVEPKKRPYRNKMLSHKNKMLSYKNKMLSYENKMLSNKNVFQTCSYKEKMLLLRTRKKGV